MIGLVVFVVVVWLLFWWLPKQLEQEIKRRGIRRAWEAQERAKARIWAEESRRR